MKFDEDGFTGARGLRIHRRTWRPVAAPVATVTIVHGMAEHGGRYEAVASSLVADGCAVVAIDLRGHGRSEGTRLDVISFDDHVADTLHALRSARAADPGLPAFLLGHSMGGLVALLLAVRHPDEVQFLVLSGALTAVPAGISPFTLAAARLLARLAPRAGVSPVDLALVSRDPEVVRAYMADPLVSHVGKIPARLGMEMFGAIGEVRSRVGSFTKPLLVMHGAADRLSDPEGSRYVYDHAASPDKTLKIYEGLFHEIFNEPERDLVLADLRAWLAGHR
ncbi:MAG: lysophospholipase [Candidatus Dormibacteraceae bacterium]